jgi:general secretion pathway protein K
MTGGRRGIAQLLVLWALVLLGTLALGFSLSMRTEAQAARNGVDDARAYFQARTGVMRTVALLSSVPADNVARMEIAGREGDASYAVRVESESGKVDINLVQDGVLLEILRKGGLPDDAAESVRDAILDWRDPDDTPRPRGAEWPDYARLPEAVQPRDGKFGDVGELRYVMGVTPEFYERFLSKVFTAHGNSPQVSVSDAPEAVLRALPGVSPEAAKELVAQRKAGASPQSKDLAAMAAGLGITAEGLALLSGSRASAVYTITATGSAGGGVVHAIRCLVEVAAGGKKGVMILRWLDQAPREAEG